MSLDSDPYDGRMSMVSGSKYPNEVWQEEEVSMRVGEPGTPELVLTPTPWPKADLGTLRGQSRYPSN